MPTESISRIDRGVNQATQHDTLDIDQVTLYHLARFHAGLPADHELLRQALSPHGLEEITEWDVGTFLRRRSGVMQALARINPEGESPSVPPVRIDEPLPDIPVQEVLHYYETEQDGDAMLLVRLFRGRVLYDPLTGYGYVWDGVRWVADRTEYAQQGGDVREWFIALAKAKQRGDDCHVSNARRSDWGVIISGRTQKGGRS